MEDNATDDGDHNEPDSGGGDPNDEDEDTDEEEQQFDISLAASHSYMGAGLVAVGGRCVLEAGWEGRVPVLAHHGAVFPGETVPMLLPHAHDAAVLARAIKNDKLFGLLCPDESGTMVSGYGVLCEVFEAGLAEGQDAPSSLTFKARANHRFRFVEMPKRSVPIHIYKRMRSVEVRVLPEVQPGAPLRHARLLPPPPPAAPAPPALDSRMRSMDAVVTPWPLFLYDIFDYRRMRQIIEEYFKTIMFDKLPEDPVSLSFWVASNLTLSARDRLALFVVDNALLRLHMEVKLISRKSVLCCSSCMGEIARRENIFAMSSEGVHSNYTNLGGYMHDIVTVSAATNTELSGSPSAEYSWFPGYTWTVALCLGCMAHVGWRFDAQKRNLRPQRFYGLCRNYVQPRAHDDRDRSYTPPLPPGRQLLLPD
ncbi:protein cereblon [Achroia grisella]|uniref:protein cereblon n=1 Tax=Achroia grisella TaxID=688607 RepID=UPI0027D200DE|nr:protein cereblon [Achroia grisella]